MAILLNIDTATDYASVCITSDNKMLAIKENAIQKEHASFLHPAINSLLAETGLKPQMIDAVAITSGPGSYTGLRVAMAAAKGWCYATNKPLIAVNTLQVMTKAAVEQLMKDDEAIGSSPLFCPMIDARRLEVFTAIYDKAFNALLSPCAMVLAEGIFDKWLMKDVYFFGSGSEKFKPFVSGKANFVHIQHNACHLGLVALEFFKSQRFSNIAYLEPEYLKDFHTTSKQSVL